MPIETLRGQLGGPLLEALLQAVLDLGANPLELRRLRAENAPQPVEFFQGTLTGTAVHIIGAAQQGDRTFTSAFYSFETSSGTGRYMITQNPPVSPTTGFFIPGGASFLTIPGPKGVRNFAMMAEGGQTLRFTRVLFE